MSLYNILFGANHGGPDLVALLSDVQSIDVGRYRDAWVEADGDRVIIRIHTRNGGGNRDGYEFEIESMRSHPWFLRDADDDFDSTYADFYFAIPAEKLTEELVATAQPPVDDAEFRMAWNAAIDAIRNSAS